MRKTEDGQPPWRRFAGLGFELFGALAGFVLLGTWIDRTYDTSPRGVVICAILGIIGGLYKLIHSALSTLTPSVKPAQARDSGDGREDEGEGSPGAGDPS